MIRLCSAAAAGMVILLLLSLPWLPCGDTSDDEYAAVQSLLHRRHTATVEYLKTQQSKLKPSYQTSSHPHQMELLELTNVRKQHTHHHQMDLPTRYHHTSHQSNNNAPQMIQDNTHMIRDAAHMIPDAAPTLQSSPQITQDSLDSHVIPDELLNSHVITDDKPTSHTSQEAEDHFRILRDTLGSGDIGSGPIVVCKDPPAPVNGDFMSNGTFVIYVCEDGYELVGNQNRSCDLTNGCWDGSDPTCEAIPCAQDEPYSGPCDTKETTVIYYYHAHQDRCLPLTNGCPAPSNTSSVNSYTDLDECFDRCRASCDGPDTEGAVRLHRASWQTSDCRICTCTNGQVSCDPVQCPVVDCGEDEPVTPPDECCPICPMESCESMEQMDGVITRLHGSNWITQDCMQCFCFNGVISCDPYTPTCDATPTCNDTSLLVVSLETGCCPICVEDTSKCLVGDVIYNDGETFVQDDCTICQCVMGTVSCNVTTCEPCDNGTEPVPVEGECCPTCVPLGACKRVEEEPEIMVIFDVCASIQPVRTFSCPEKCYEANKVQCCSSHYDTDVTEFECDPSPGLTLELKYLYVSNCECSDCVS